MVLDIAVAVVVVGAMAFGFRNGFAYTFFHTAGWALALVLAFVCSPWVKNALVQNPGVYTPIQQSLLERFSDSLLSRQLANALPDLLQSATQTLVGQTAEYASLLIADLLITIISFLLVVFVAKLVFWLLAGSLSKKRGKGTRGFFDSVLGLSFGFIKGMILVFVLFAVMVPVAGLIDPRYTEFLMEGLRSSYFAGTLYDNNLIILIVRDFLT